MQLAGDGLWLHLSEPADLEADATVYPVKEALLYVPGTPIGDSDQGSQGDAFYTVKNPPFGAIISYRLKEGLKKREDQRREAEKKKVKEGEPVGYPGWEALRAEDREIDPVIVLTIRDARGDVGRIALRRRFRRRLGGERRSHWAPDPTGPFTVPGQYTVSLSRRVDGVETELAGPVEFTTRLLGRSSTPAKDFDASIAFQREAADLFRAVQGAGRTLDDAQERLDHIRKAVDVTPGLDRALLDEIDAIETRLKDMGILMNGDRTIARRSEPTTPGISSRVSQVLWGTREITSDPTQTQRDNLALAGKLFAPLLADLKVLVEKDLADLEQRLDEAGAPFTPGRIPAWSGN